MKPLTKYTLEHLPCFYSK